MNQYKQTLYIEDMQTVAANKGGKCLSPIYLGSRAKLEWECSEGHSSNPSVAISLNTFQQYNLNLP